MSLLKGSASYKKKAGVLALAADHRSVSWTAAGASAPDLNMAVASITNLQQTPASSPKVMLKIFEQPAGGSGGGGEATAHTFTFSANDQGRAEAGAIRDALSKAILTLKSAATTTATAAATGSGPATPAAAASPARADGAGGSGVGGGGASAAMAIAAAVSTNGTAAAAAGSKYDDDKLLDDGALQQALLNKDKQLASTFQRAMKARPSSIAITTFNKQFWTARVRLLRAFAVEQAQKKGEYNVLGAVKPRMEGDVFKLSLTPDQAQLILRQYPVVQKANREASQKGINQATFWTRFFQSRLHKKLKGEKILDTDKKDDLLDDYLENRNDDLKRQQKLLAAHVPHTIDLAGNEQDNSQKLGNAPDYLNRPNAAERVPIMRTLNSISERLLSQVSPNDVDPSQPIGVDEATFNEMALKDLAGESETQHRLLNIKDKAKFFATGKGGGDEDDDISSSRIFKGINPQDALKTVNGELKAAEQASLFDAIGVDDSDDADEDLEDGDAARDTHVGSRASRRKATRQIFKLVRERKVQVHDQLAGLDEEGIAAEFSLSLDTYKEVLLTNAAAVVFLAHFWSAFHSGDAGRAGELQGVVEALGQYVDTFRGIGDAAERERQKKIEERRRMLRAHFEKTGKKIALDSGTIKGGRAVVEQLVASTLRPIRRAQEAYERAMGVAQLVEAQAQ